jgi:hypothetical protein
LTRQASIWQQQQGYPPENPYAQWQPVYQPPVYQPPVYPPSVYPPGYYREKYLKYKQKYLKLKEALKKH